MSDVFMDAEIKLGPSDFDGRRLKKPGTWVVLFAAEWCPFCRKFSPVFNSSLAQKKMPTVLADLSDYENPLWETFDVQVVPTVMVFSEGGLAYRMDGGLGEGLPDNAMKEVFNHVPAVRKATN
jgi:thioredoxin-like negative regulator of GroEL